MCCKSVTGKIKSNENQPPFNNEAYSAFKRGNVVKGILCPSLTNSFRARSLERSYLTYSHRQRQKSLLIVNIVDLMLKIVLAIVWICRNTNEIVCIQCYKILIVSFSFTHSLSQSEILITHFSYLFIYFNREKNANEI